MSNRSDQSGKQGKNPRYILAPLNGGNADQAVIEFACEEAKRIQGRVYALHVIEVKHALPLEADLPEEAAFGDKVLRQAEQIGIRKGVRIETAIIQARSIGATIVDEALEHNAEMIVLGIVYRRRFGEFNLGLTMLYVMRNAPCRVWMCREPLSVAAQALT